MSRSRRPERKRSPSPGQAGKQNAQGDKPNPEQASKQNAPTATRPAVRQRSKQFKVVRASVWLLSTLVLILFLFWFFPFIDRPERGYTRDTSEIFDSISNNFSVGFDSADLRKTILLRKDDAIKLKWSRTGGRRGMAATLEVGPYEVLNEKAESRLVFMVPADAEVLQCDGLDYQMGATSKEPASYIPYRPVRCEVAQYETAKFVFTSLVPSEFAVESSTMLSLAITVAWDDPNLYRLGIGREHMFFRYQGRFIPINPQAGLLPADQVRLSYDTSRTSDTSGLPLGVYLQYELGDPNSRFLDVAPEGQAASNNRRIWVSTPNQPTYKLNISTENQWRRRQLDIAIQLVFLIVGAGIGATWPALKAFKSR